MVKDSDHENRDDAPGDPPYRDHKYTINPPSTISSSVRAIVIAIDRAGYDAADPESMRQFTDDLRAWKEHRENAQKRASTAKSWWLAGLTAVVTVIAGSLIQWLPALWKLLFGSSTHHGGAD